ncbi:MAG: metallophosphoesterase [Treponema sp.]|nr:metallophosphoesterase [Treponema sp.]
MPKSCKIVLRLEENAAGRDFVCGDIHGCFDDLEEGLRGIGFDKARDRIFCVGDLIDRGPKSGLAGEYMRAPWFFSVTGNHERMFCDANAAGMPRRFLAPYVRRHVANGGDWAYDALSPEVRREIREEANSLPLVIRVGNILIAHAALPEVENLEEIEENPAEYLGTMTWLRGPYPAMRIPGIERVYVGHSIVGEPLESGKYLNVDTGAFLKYWGKKGMLTILEI